MMQKRNSFWTDQREQRLVKLYDQYRGSKKGNVYSRLAKQLRATSTNAVYKKLGRMGVLQAPWSIAIRSKHSK
jgi:hypothetical protein